MNKKFTIRFGIVFAALFCLTQAHAAPPAGLSDKIAALKKSLEQNKANLKILFLFLFL